MATKSIVPRATGEGGIGTAAKKWLAGYISNLYSPNLVLGSDADGDMYYRASSALARLAKGTASQTLKMDSGATAPEWVTVAGVSYASAAEINAGTEAAKAIAPDQAKLSLMRSAAYELTDGATIAIDWDNGSSQYVVLGATGRTVTFADPVNGQVYRFIIIQDATGSRTITTWPTVKWSGGAAPVLSTAANAIDIVTLLYVNSVYYGDCAYAFAAPA